VSTGRQAPWNCSEPRPDNARPIVLIATTAGVIASKGQRPPLAAGYSNLRWLPMCAPPLFLRGPAASRVSCRRRVELPRQHPKLSPARGLPDGGALFLMEIHDAQAAWCCVICECPGWMGLAYMTGWSKLDQHLAAAACGRAATNYLWRESDRNRFLRL
jgi:hypothetical protein